MSDIIYRDFALWMSENGYHADDDAPDVFEAFCEEQGLTEVEAEELWDSF